MANIKETLISTMENGKEVLLNIKYSRENGRDIVNEKGKVQSIVSKLHRDRMTLVLSEIIPQTENAKSFRFVSEEGYLPPFEAGQYINVAVEIEGVRATRPYSISSSPKERSFYEITVARVQKGFVADYMLDCAKVGDKFEINGPAGVFRFNPVFHSKKSVFLAGGSGITPFMSMTKEILESGLDREIYLIYGSRNVESAIFHKELKEFAKSYKNFKYTLVTSDEGAQGGDRQGFIDTKCISEIVGDTQDKTYYMCGPQIMTDFCFKALKELNIKDKDIRREMFGSTADITKEPNYPTDVKADDVFNVKIGDKTIPAKASESLLQAIERSGLRINVCCRSGECSLCRVKLVSGKVFMPRGVLLRLADEKFGYIHSCKAYPISDMEIMF